MDIHELADAGIRVEHGDGILNITLNTPDRLNAQTPATWAALAHLGANLPQNTRVVVLRGAGVSFSAGMDTRMFTPDGVPGQPGLVDIVSGSDEEGGKIIATFQEAFTWWRKSEAITIAAVQGHAIGAGFQLALACDLMIVADDVKLSMKESAYGLVPDLAGTHPLICAVGPSAALEICLTARRIGAEEAVASGLAVRAVPAESLHAAADELAATIAGLIPGTASATKQLLAGATRRSHQEQCQAERETQMGRLRTLVAAMSG